jgi:hypothetical protein
MSLFRAAARRPGVAALVLGAAVLGSSVAQASEGGTSFYLLGSGGPGAAILPPVQGVFFDNTTYYYSGKASTNRQFVVGGNVVAGLKAKVVADFATLLWVPSTDVMGGTLAVGGLFVVGHPDIDVSAVITGPRGGQTTVTRSDKDLLISDPVATAELSWKAGANTHVAISALANIPIGQYKEDELANLAFHRWALDTSAAVTWHDAKAGWDVSAKAGVTFNGENHHTDYETGTELHLEAAVERIFSPKFSAGLQAYHFDQLSGDSGPGAALGANKGQVTAIGVTAAYNFHIGKAPVTARLRVFEEFSVKRRLDGTAAMFSLTLPLSVKLPPGAH